MIGPTEKMIDAAMSAYATSPAFERREQMREALTAALAVEAGTVGVKPLEWTEHVIGDGTCLRQNAWTADRYQIVESPSGKFDLRNGAYAICDTLEAAKAAAQADYEARIRSALTTSPASSGVEGEAVAWQTMDSAPNEDGLVIEVSRAPDIERWNAARFLRLKADCLDLFRWRPAAPSLSSSAGGEE